jgi:nucleotide-binding universal stress UspA family protein
MTVIDLSRPPEMTGGGTAGRSTKRLVVVAGYDGSAPAGHALDHAADLLQGRDGSIEVVFVSHLPASAAGWGAAFAEITQGLDDQAETLAEEVRARLVGEDHPWHFQHRAGAVATELLAVAAEVHRQYGDSAEVVIAVGGPSHRYHHLVGSVGVSLVHTDRFPVVVVP